MSVEDLIAAFGAELGMAATNENRFGSPSLGWLGVCDGAAGVQWNAWVHRGENAAYVGVNLEGLTYDGWPIARFIEREFRHPRLFEVVKQLPVPEAIELIVHRDAWRFASRPAIEEKHVGLSGRVLTAIDSEGWKRTLQEAYECLDANRGHRGRGRQIVTTKSGKVEMSVSPHLQFRQRISEAAEAHQDWTSRVRRGREALQPLYTFVKEQSAA
jgi:hypothetical protein